MKQKWRNSSTLQDRNPEKIQEYTGDILLVGINYNRETKRHSCLIEHFTKEA